MSQNDLVLSRSSSVEGKVDEQDTLEKRRAREEEEREEKRR